MHRRTNLNWSVETLEGRILLSGSAEPAGRQGPRRSRSILSSTRLRPRYSLPPRQPQPAIK